MMIFVRRLIVDIDYLGGKSARFQPGFYNGVCRQRQGVFNRFALKGGDTVSPVEEKLWVKMANLA